MHFEHAYVCVREEIHILEYYDKLNTIWYFRNCQKEMRWAVVMKKKMIENSKRNFSNENLAIICQVAYLLTHPTIVRGSPTWAVGASPQ